MLICEVLMIKNTLNEIEVGGEYQRKAFRNNAGSIKCP